MNQELSFQHLSDIQPDGQYEVIGLRPVMPFFVDFTVNGVRSSTFCYVDYARDSVIFPDPALGNNEKLRLAVLARLDVTAVHEISVPAVPHGVLEQLDRIQRGEYSNLYEESNDDQRQ